MYSLPEHFIKEHNLEVIYQFPVMYSGWECDYNGWVVEEIASKERKIVLSNHNTLYFADIKEIEECIDEYQDVINKTKKALELLKNDC